MTIGASAAPPVIRATSARGSSTARASTRTAATITESTPRTSTGRAVGGVPSHVRPSTASAPLRQFNQDPPLVQRTGAPALGYGNLNKHCSAYVRTALLPLVLLAYACFDFDRSIMVTGTTTVARMKSESESIANMYTHTLPATADATPNVTTTFGISSSSMYSSLVVELPPVCKYIGHPSYDSIRNVMYVPCQSGEIGSDRKDSIRRVALDTGRIDIIIATQINVCEEVQSVYHDATRDLLFVTCGFPGIQMWQLQRDGDMKGMTLLHTYPVCLPQEGGFVNGLAYDRLGDTLYVICFDAFVSVTSISDPSRARRRLIYQDNNHTCCFFPHQISYDEHHDIIIIDGIQWTGIRLEHQQEKWTQQYHAYPNRTVACSTSGQSSLWYSSSSDTVVTTCVVGSQGDASLYGVANSTTARGMYGHVKMADETTLAQFNCTRWGQVTYDNTRDTVLVACHNISYQAHIASTIRFLRVLDPWRNLTPSSVPTRPGGPSDLPPGASSTPSLIESISLPSFVPISGAYSFLHMMYAAQHDVTYFWYNRRLLAVWSNTSSYQPPHTPWKPTNSPTTNDPSSSSAATPTRTIVIVVVICGCALMVAILLGYRRWNRSAQTRARSANNGNPGQPQGLAFVQLRS